MAFVTSDLSPAAMNRLVERFEVQHGGWGCTQSRLTPEELVQVAATAEVLLVSYEQVPGWAIEALPRLRLIGCTRSTPVNIDLAVATSRGIPVLHTPGRNTQCAAEFTLGLMLAAAHHIAQAHYALRRGEYLGPPVTAFEGADRSGDVIWNIDGKCPFKDLQGFELADHYLGIIGLGKIGRQVARLAQALDMHVIAYSPHSSPEEAAAQHVQLVDLDSLLQQADIISIHAGVTHETWGMLGPWEFSLMKPSAYLINISRAAIIDQAALIEALQQGRIAGAALDVFWFEPLPANHPLLSMDNVTLTPHLGGAALEVTEHHSRMIVDDVLAWLDGNRPLHLANPQVWELD